MGRSIVLMYHDIVRRDCSESGFQNPTAMKYKVKADEFERQVAAIARYLKAKKMSTEAVEFTFDDGGVTFLTEAAPILERYGFKGVFFVATQCIDTEGFLSKKQIIDLRDRGHIVGAHSHTHPDRMTVLSQQQLDEEWCSSTDILAYILGEKPTCASIPNGYSSADVIRAMALAGITDIYTSEPTTHCKTRGNTIVKGRYAVTDTDTVETVMRLVDSRLTRIYKAARFNCLALAKSLLGESYLRIRESLLKK